MTDVLDLARQRRDELLAQVSALEEFIRTGEWLIDWNRGNGVRSALASLKPFTPGGPVAPEADTSELARRLSRRSATG